MELTREINILSEEEKAEISNSENFPFGISGNQRRRTNCL